MEHNDIKTKIQSIKELFINIRDTLSRNQIDQIRTKFYKKEAVYDFLTKKDKLTRKESKVLDNINTYFNELHDYLSKQNKYQYNPYALDILFNDNDYYKPIKIKRAFNGNYVLYESNANEDRLLYIHEYLHEIKLYLRDFIVFYNTKGEGKVQLSMSVTFISYINTDQIQLMHSKSDNVKTKRGVNANDTIQELISTFLQQF